MTLSYPQVHYFCCWGYNTEQVFLMAVVYLPYGYPIQSGSVSETLIYQGVVVRAYEIPIDPRTNEQLFQRRFLADTSKVRSMLGTWGRGAVRTVFGSKWGSVVYQLIKADEAGHWVEAETLWNGFISAERTAWRDVAPYLATFNDPGKMFFCYARVLAELLIDFSGLAWESVIWGVGDSAAARTWWEKSVSDALIKGEHEETAAAFNFVGSWGRDDGAPNYGLHGGYAEFSGNNASDVVSFYYYGRTLKYGFLRASNQNNVNLLIDVDGQLAVPCYSVTRLAQQVVEFDAGFKGLHYVRSVKSVGQQMNLDWVQIV